MVQKLRPDHLNKTIVGLTGGFGTGKTTVAHFFEELGACVVDADKLAHEALMVDSPVYEKIKEAFKEAVLSGNPGLDLKKLAGIIFHDEKKRKKLESFIHPYVLDRIMEEVSESEESVVVVEVPLLFETGYDRFCQQVIVVNAPEALTVERLREKGFSQEEINARKSAQMPLEDKLKRAGMIINNSGTFQQTRREVENIWKKLYPASKGAA